MLGPIISLTDLVNLSARNSKQKRLNLKEKVELIEDHGWNGYEIDELSKKYQIANTPKEVATTHIANGRIHYQSLNHSVLPFTIVVAKRSSWMSN